MKQKYPGYKISTSYPLAEVVSSITPKGLNVNTEIGFVLHYYIVKYKGVRKRELNCFMFGIDKETMWYDYDLTIAYTTVMFMARQPDYGQYRRLSQNDLNKMSHEEILYSYLIL
jgi:hypothetical protein